MATEEERSNGAFASVLYSEPGALGLLSNALPALVVAILNFCHGSYDGYEAHVLAGAHLIMLGGVLQLLAGVLSFRRNDHLGGTAFLSFSSFWAAQGVLKVVRSFLPDTFDVTSNVSAINDDIIHARDVTQNATVAGLVGFILISALLFTSSLIVNYIMPPIQAAILLSLTFELIGVFHTEALYAAGAFEILIVVISIYGTCASIFRGMTQRHVWPGFGTAPVNALLLPTKGGNDTHSQAGQKKNTKHAEPMALGYLGNIPPTCVMIFYGFGFVSNFELTVVWLFPAMVAQTLACYYAHLRNDMLHAVRFALYLVVWMGVVGTEFLFCAAGPFHLAPHSFSALGIWSPICLLLCLVLASLTRDVIGLFSDVTLIIFLLSGYEYIPESTRKYLYAVAGCLVLLVSSYASLASLINAIAEKYVLPVGQEAVSRKRMTCFLRSLSCNRHRCSNLKEAMGSDLSSTVGLQPSQESSHTPEAIVFCLLAVASVFGACTDLSSNTSRVACSVGVTNGVNASSGAETPSGMSTSGGVEHSPSVACSTDVFPGGTACVHWVLAAGGVLLLHAARCAIATRDGGVMMATGVTTWAAFWVAYSLHVISGQALNQRFVATLLVLCSVCVSLSSIHRSRVWLLLSLLMSSNALGFLLQKLDNCPQYLHTVTMLLTGLVSLYGACSHILNNSVDVNLLSLGKPLVTSKPSTSVSVLGPPACPLFDSSRTSGLRAVAALLDAGKLVGVPTDTVYALAASCKHPISVLNIYRVKDRPADKPICLCLSNIEQLTHVQTPFSALLWRFMKNCYPGGITCVVPKGDWLRALGVGESQEFVGMPSSVAIRVPDHGPLAHLIDMTGPLAITSANPSGEPDSTHHNMVLDRLGHKIDGLLCDGPSNEEVASTVVNCMEIDQGEISFFRIGCVPKEAVLDIFEKTKTSFTQDAGV